MFEREDIDVLGRQIRLTEDRLVLLAAYHPELQDPIERVAETLTMADRFSWPNMSAFWYQFVRISEVLFRPDQIVASTWDPDTEFYYKLHSESHHEHSDCPARARFLCAMVKSPNDAGFVVTAYYTDSIRKGSIVWQKR